MDESEEISENSVVHPLKEEKRSCENREKGCATRISHWVLSAHLVRLVLVPQACGIDYECCLECNTAIAVLDTA